MADPPCPGPQRTGDLPLQVSVAGLPPFCTDPPWSVLCPPHLCSLWGPGVSGLSVCLRFSLSVVSCVLSTSHDSRGDTGSSRQSSKPRTHGPRVGGIRKGVCTRLGAASHRLGVRGSACESRLTRSNAQSSSSIHVPGPHVGLGRRAGGTRLSAQMMKSRAPPPPHPHPPSRGPRGTGVQH